MERLVLARLVCLLALLLFGTSASAEDLADVVRESRYVAVRDGTRLAVNVYRPAENGVAVSTPLPVVFAFTPYRARFKDENGAISERSPTFAGREPHSVPAGASRIGPRRKTVTISSNGLRVSPSPTARSG